MELTALTDLSVWIVLSLILFSFLAGLIDAVAGGGGLIQLPALLISLPNTPIPTLFGTNKIAALSGTSLSAYQYSKRIVFDLRLLITLSLVALLSSFAGAKAVSYLNVNILKPLVLVILIAIALYTFFKKELGSVASKELPFHRKVIYGALLGMVIGFYDGFFGPGTGSFLVLGFVVVIGFDFVTASAYAKLVNCMTNVGALFVFVREGKYILSIAIIMAASNIAGNYTGTHLALLKGNSFVRKLFLVVVILLIIRYGWDVYQFYFN